jgi:integral membrane sensor domain MASE1
LSVGLLLLGIFIPEALIFHFMGSDTPLWLTNAVAVTILVRNTSRVWPGLILVQIFADSASATIFGDGFVAGVGGAICSAFEILAVSAVLHTMARSGDVFSSLRRISKFAAVCVIVPVFSGAGGAVVPGESHLK